MKSIFTITFTLFLALTSILAQVETSAALHDTISEGPFLTPEKGGYNFTFKTQKVGTMVSTRGQVINPSIPYEEFNHYHINKDGELVLLTTIR